MLNITLLYTSELTCHMCIYAYVSSVVNSFNRQDRFCCYLVSDADNFVIKSQPTNAHLLHNQCNPVARVTGTHKLDDMEEQSANRYDVSKKTRKLRNRDCAMSVFVTLLVTRWQKTMVCIISLWTGGEVKTRPWMHSKNRKTWCVKRNIQRGKNEQSYNAYIANKKSRYGCKISTQTSKCYKCGRAG